LAIGLRLRTIGEAVMISSETHQPKAARSDRNRIATVVELISVRRLDRYASDVGLGRLGDVDVLRRPDRSQQGYSERAHPKRGFLRS
jgi:hypothetical protein